MPRRREVPKREIIPDPKYHSQLVAKFVNCILRRGKKSTAERVLYKSFDIVSEKTQSDPLKVLKKALENVKPALEVKSRRVGGSTYQVPIEVKPERRQALAIRWILEFAKERTEQSMEQRLAGEAGGDDVGVVLRAALPRPHLFELEEAGADVGLERRPLAPLGVGEARGIDRRQTPRERTKLANLSIDGAAAQVFEEIVMDVDAVERRAGRLHLVQVGEVFVDEMGERFG